MRIGKVGGEKICIIWLSGRVWRKELAYQDEMSSHPDPDIQYIAASQLVYYI